MSCLFSIIVVCLNPGKRISDTLESIRKQTFRDFEVIIKDGLSTDDTETRILEYKDLPIHFWAEKDTGIYDAMNQAISHSEGRYIYFLNCGDIFASSDVLRKVADEIKENSHNICIYGDIFERVTGTKVKSNPVINGFTCYRNVPCHQACFYERGLLTEHPFETKYRVRADYEHFLWCFYKAKASFRHMDFIVADYEGDGYSESKKGKKLSKAEHKDITKKYMSRSELFKYKAILTISLAPLRTLIARNPITAGIYNKIKERIYSRK